MGDTKLFREKKEEKKETKLSEDFTYLEVHQYFKALWKRTGDLEDEPNPYTVACDQILRQRIRGSILFSSKYESQDALETQLRAVYSIPPAPAESIAIEIFRLQKEVVIPSTSISPPWGSTTKDPKSWKECSDDVRSHFAIPGGLKENDPRVDWEHSEKLSATADDLVELYRSYISAANSNPETATIFSEGVHYLGEGVFSLLPSSTSDTESLEYDASPLEGGKEIILRSEVNELVDRVLEFSQQKKNVYISGQPGIGKTRGSMMLALMKLLNEGASVIRVANKLKKMHLFIPNNEGNYMVWQAPNIDLSWSRLISDRRMVLLIDPPERGEYVSDAGCRIIKFCSNNDKHFKNAEKDNTVLFAPLPNEEQIMAMVPVLWREGKKDNATDPTGKIGRKEDGSIDWEERKAVIADRVRLVGSCAPRYVFHYQKYVTRIAHIQAEVEADSRNISLPELQDLVGFKKRGCGNLGEARTEKLFNIDVVRDRKWVWPTLQLNDLAGVLMQRKLLKLTRNLQGPAGGWIFEDVVMRMLAMGGNFIVKKSTSTKKVNAKGRCTQSYTANKPGKVEIFDSRKIQQGGDKESTSQSLEILNNDDKHLLVPGIANYPGIDFAFSRLQWIQVKVNETKGFQLKVDVLEKLLDRIKVEEDEKVQLLMVHNGLQNIPKCQHDFSPKIEKHVEISFLDVTEPNRPPELEASDLKDMNVEGMVKFYLKKHRWPNKLPTDVQHRMALVDFLLMEHSNQLERQENKE